MSIAIVCMVNHTAVKMLSNDTLAPNTTREFACQRIANIANASDAQDGPFVWEKSVQGHILGAFFYGYLVSQVPMGMLAGRIGGKWVMVGCLGVSTLGMLLSPMAARIHWGALVVIRVLVGVGSGGVFPAMHTIWGRWAPPKERTILTGVSYAGAMMGNVIGLPVSGILCKYGFDGGWASIFYVFGIAAILWLVVWSVLVTSTPGEQKHMSEKEQNYILRSLKGQVSDNKSKEMVPWLSVFTSLPVYAIMVANICSDWGLYTLLTNIPTYMKEVLNFDLAENGTYSALPYLFLWVNMNISPFIADKLLATNKCTTTVVRKIFNTIGLLGAALALVALSFVDCTNPGAAIAFLCLGVAISGCAYSGFLVNHMDIAPQFAGTLFGLTNCVAAITGFVAPYIASALTTKQTQKEWQIVFFIAAGMYAVGALFYIIFGSGELQKWASVKPATEEEVTLDEKPTKAVEEKPRLNGE